MLDNIFEGIFDSSAESIISVGDFLLCITISLVIGLLLACSYIYKSNYTKSFVVTLAALPAVVCVVIMMVNGNIGAGVAVAGAFSLVRFRSVPGTAKEIGAIFIAMGAGLAAGMGYITYALLFTIIMVIVSVVYNVTRFGDNKRGSVNKMMRITIPEDLDYTGVFDDLLDEYTSFYDITQVKTTNMGSLFRISYNITLKDKSKEKEFIDKLRCRNGNLEISISRQETSNSEL